MEESLSEFLTVRLSRDPQSPIRWLVWSTSQNEIIASGEISSSEQLIELSAYAEQRTTLLLLDSRDVLLIEADIPVGAARKVDSMLPYLLEDDIAQDVEELHFSIMNKSANTVQVAAIDKAYLSECLQAFIAVGIDVNKVLPEALALPILDNKVSALKMDSQWLFRKSEYQSTSISQEWLPTFLDSNWCNNEDERYIVQSYNEIPESQQDNLNWTVVEPELAMELLTKGAITSPINLLSGTFKPQSSILKNLKVWKKVAIAASFFLVVFTVQQYLQVSKFEQQASAYRNESERIFRTIFPNKKRIPTVSYLKRQMTDEENALTNSGSGTSVLDWLSLLPEALKNQESVNISNIRYDAKRGEIRLEASMDDFQSFEVVKTKLAEKFVVNQGPLARKENRVSGSFVLRRKQ